MHGPFPIRGWVLLAGLGFLAVGVMVALVGLDQALLSCDLANDHCVYRRTTLIETRPRTFRLSEIAGVRTERVRSNKRTRGVVVLDLTIGQQRLKTTSVEESERAAARIQTALDCHSRRFDVWLRADRWMAFFGVLFMAAAGALVWFALRDAGRFVLHVKPPTLVVVQRIFGVPVRRATFSAAAVTDVRVEWHRRKSFFDHRRDIPETTGRLLLVTDPGPPVPLTERHYRGFTVHKTAEQALREALDLPPRPSRRQAELDAEYERFRPPTSDTWSGWGAKLGAAWTGACCGALLGFGGVGRHQDHCGRRAHGWSHQHARYGSGGRGRRGLGSGRGSQADSSEGAALTYSPISCCQGLLASEGKRAELLDRAAVSEWCRRDGLNWLAGLRIGIRRGEAGPAVRSRVVGKQIDHSALNPHAVTAAQFEIVHADEPIGTWRDHGRERHQGVAAADSRSRAMSARGMG